MTPKRWPRVSAVRTPTSAVMPKTGCSSFSRSLGTENLDH